MDTYGANVQSMLLLMVPLSSSFRGNAIKVAEFLLIRSTLGASGPGDFQSQTAIVRRQIQWQLLMSC